MTQPAQQRTALAWGRTSLVTGGFGVAMLRLGVVRHSIPELIAAVGLFVCAVLLAACGKALYRAAGARSPTMMIRLATLAVIVVGSLVAATAVG